MSHEHVVVVRFSETDGQGVVFNGSYPVYADCAFDAWLERAMGKDWAWTCGRSVAVAASSKWNFKKSAKFLDRVRIACRVPRWGTTSFDVEYVGTVDGGACFDGLVTYVSVDAETRRPTPVPQDLKEALSATRSKM
jgi:acyl-CoA thioester hydrolase